MLVASVLRLAVGVVEPSQLQLSPRLALHLVLQRGALQQQSL